MRNLLLATGALLLAACGPRSAETEPTVLSLGPGTVVSSGLQAGAPLMDLVGTQPEDIRFLGERTVRVHHQNWVESHRERVASDGQGQFLLEPIEVLSSHMEQGMYLLLQTGRAPYAFRYRDFRVRDGQRFVEQYLVSEQPSLGSVAGLETHRLHIQRRDGTGSTWVVDLHPATGLVLGFVESDGQNPVLEVTFDWVDLDPDLSQEPLSTHRFQRVPLDPTASLSAQVGSPLLEPALLPSGYELQELSIMQPDPQDPSTHWVRSEFCDGVDRVILLQRSRDLSTFYNGASKGKVRSDHLGTWRFITGRLAGHELVLAGKVPEQALLEMLQSSL